MYLGLICHPKRNSEIHLKPAIPPAQANLLEWR
jgi:hypothetical protein